MPTKKKKPTMTEISNHFNRHKPSACSRKVMSAQRFLCGVYPGLYYRISGYRNSGPSCDLGYIKRCCKREGILWIGSVKHVILQFLNTTEEEHNDEQGYYEGEEQEAVKVGH